MKTRVDSDTMRMSPGSRPNQPSQPRAIKNPTTVTMTPMDMITDPRLRVISRPYPSERMDPVKTYEVELESGRRIELLVPPPGCDHLDHIHEAVPGSDGCKECLELGDPWFHLRLCLFCGHVGCCDSSKNRHATKHHHATGHAIIQSFQPDEDWMYCYPDDVVIEPA